MSHIIAPRPARRGIQSVQASVDAALAQTITALDADWRQFRANHENELSGVTKELEKIQMHLVGIQMGAGHRGDRLEDPNYSAAFGSWVRGGRDEEAVRSANREGARGNIMAAMTAGSDTAGGYLAPVEWDRRVREQLLPISPMRNLADVQTTTVRGYSSVWSSNAWGSGWVGETAARPETSTPVLSPIGFDHGEIYANASITQQLLDDVDFDAGNWLTAKIADEFSRQESIAFIAGNGVNKPRGLLTYAPGGLSAAVHPGGPVAIGVTVAATTAITPDELLDLTYALPLPYRAAGVWLLSSRTAGVLARLKDADGRFLWAESLVAGQPSSLLGYPVAIDENMPDPVAGALPIAFGDFRRGYVINDRVGVRVLRDPYTNKPYVMFYATKRVGGGVQDPHAIRFLRMAAS